MKINETSFNITKAIYEKFRVNIILSSEKLSLPSKLWNKTRIPTLITFIQYSIGTYSYSNDQDKEVKVIQIGKEEVKLPYVDDKILYLENLKDSTKNLS